MSHPYKSFREFYPFYLAEHANAANRRLHFCGSWIVLVIIVISLFTKNAWWLLLTPVVGYGFAWVGHFYIEKNRPATFTHPLYSLMGDWVMWKDIVMGKIKL